MAVPITEVDLVLNIWMVLTVLLYGPGARAIIRMSVRFFSLHRDVEVITPPPLQHAILNIGSAVFVN